MISDPVVSVVIPFYNCPYVHLAVESVLAQTYRSIEIIVVDDGSTVHSEKLKPYLDRIRYIAKPNGGTATALNRGIEAARGSYFAWLSSDDVYYPDKILKQMAMLQATGHSFAHTAFYYIDPGGSILSDALNLSLLTRRALIETMRKGCPVNGSTVLIGMDVFRKVGVFNEAYRYTHDYELWLRILQHYDWDYIGEPLIGYRVHDAMGSKLHSREQNEEIALVQKKYRKQLLRLLEREGRE